MLYLVVHCEAQSDPNAFPDALTEAGEAQAEHLAKVLNLLGVQNVFVAPHRRALDSVGPFFAKRRDEGSFIRAEVHYELSDSVALPEQKPRSWALEELRPYGLNRQSLYGNIPGPEDLDAYRARVLRWYTDHFWSEYRDCPYPTAIVANSVTVGMLVYYIMLTKGGGPSLAQARSVVNNLKAGAVLELGIEDLTLRLRRRVI